MRDREVRVPRRRAAACRAYRWVFGESERFAYVSRAARIRLPKYHLTFTVVMLT